MSTIERTTSKTEHAPIDLELRTHRIITVVALAAMIIGLGSVLGGITGAAYTDDQAAAQGITTPDDALPGVPVRGPLPMWAQSDIITHHQLDSTGGQHYAEMAREVPAVDEATGEPVLDEAGEPVKVPNDARASWVTATALTTSLDLGLMADALAAFAIVVGLTLAGTGYALYRLRDAEVTVN